MKAFGIILAGFLIAIFTFLIAAFCIQLGYNTMIQSSIPATQMTFTQAAGAVCLVLGVKIGAFGLIKTKE